MIAVLPLALLTVAAPDIAPNPRNRSAMDLAPDRATTEVAMRAEVVELVDVLFHKLCVLGSLSVPPTTHHLQ